VATHPELLGKEEGEAEDEGKEFPGSVHEGLLAITAVQVNPARGSTGAMEVRVTSTWELCRKCRDMIVCVLRTQQRNSDS
jgi:hypothetical protein